ncbi:MAG TPA: hypothetical protein VFH43_10920 [Candidatus Kapabacteria bacterium]|nr:hypothetical protein [Candidatus Kapabacteria bacterium]
MSLLASPRLSFAEIDTTLFKVRQELPLPSKEVTDEWAPSALIIKSNSAYPQHLYISAINAIDTSFPSPGYSLDSMWRIADAAYSMADSITGYTMTGWVSSSEPGKYVDSAIWYATLNYLLPPHGELRIPIFIRVNPRLQYQGDTVISWAMFWSYSDSLGRTRLCNPPSFLVRCPQVFSRLFRVEQEPLPVNDSGGRWLSSALFITSQTNYAQDVRMLAFNEISSFPGYARDSVWRLADSAYRMADSIFIFNPTWPPFDTSTTPWEYLGKLTPLHKADLNFPLPANATIRIPIQIRAISNDRPPGDTTSAAAWVASYSDSLGIIRKYVTNNPIRCVEAHHGPMAAWQNFLPVNDSGGKWLPSEITLRNFTSAEVRVNIRTGSNLLNNGDTLWKMPKAAFDMAVDANAAQTLLRFRVPAMSSVVVPILVAARGKPGDTSKMHMDISCDSAWSNGEWRTFVWLKPTIRCLQACSAPYVAYDGTPLDNRTKPALLGGDPVSFEHNCLNCGGGAKTFAYKIVGEYADRFYLVDSTSWQTRVAFRGAPRSPIYDTIIGTYTNCWGTITTRTPITAYSMYASGYKYTSVAGEMLAPFLGRASAKAKIWNTSAIPITIRDLRSTGSDSVNFAASAPSVIAANDSAEITITLIDNDFKRDLERSSRNATITATVAPYGSEVPFEDSTLSISVQGRIDVWCPNYSAGSTFHLKQGVRPKGIIFSSNNKEFLTAYGNRDPGPRYFYEPYYAEPAVHAEDIELIVGKTITLPAMVPVDTGGFFAPAFVIKTTYNGDNKQNYQTKLYWPRESDTLVTDVVVIGSNAPPFKDVVVDDVSTSISVWPNPASDLVHIRNADERSTDLVILDVVGRTVRTARVEGLSTISLSGFAPGAYEFYFPSIPERRMVQIVR